MAKSTIPTRYPSGRKIPVKIQKELKKHLKAVNKGKKYHSKF